MENKSVEDKLNGIDAIGADGATGMGDDSEGTGAEKGQGVIVVDAEAANPEVNAEKAGDLGDKGDSGDSGKDASKAAEGSEGTRAAEGSEGTRAAESSEGTRAAEGSEGTRVAEGLNSTKAAEGSEGPRASEEPKYAADAVKSSSGEKKGLQKFHMVAIGAVLTVALVAAIVVLIVSLNNARTSQTSSTTTSERQTNVSDANSGQTTTEPSVTTQTQEDQQTTTETTTGTTQSTEDGSSAEAAKFIENEVFATMHNTEIRKKEYMIYHSIVKNNLLMEVGISPGDEMEEYYLSMEMEEGVTVRDQLRQDALEEMRKYKLLGILADERGTVLDAEDNAYIDSIVSSQAESMGGMTELETVIMQDYGVSLEAYTEMYKQNVLNEKYYVEMLDEISITDEDAENEYEINVHGFANVTVRHILFVNGGTSGDRSDEETAQLAEETLARVDAGEDMKRLAEELSEDPGVVDNSGEYTFGMYDNLVPEFIEWGFESEIGDTGVVTTSYGYHVMKKEDMYTTTFEEAMEDIKSAMQNRQLTEYLEGVSADPAYQLNVDEAVFSTM